MARSPHTGKLRRTIRAVRAEGELPERVEVDSDGNFSIVLAKRDNPSPPSSDHEDLDAA
jgi:hypothetical protein